MHLSNRESFRKALLIFACTIVLSSVASTYSQAQIISNIPADMPNSRFMDDSPFIKMRPGLTFAGFSGEESHALGLQQFLNQAAGSPDSPALKTFAKILTLSGQSIPGNPPIHQIEYTSNILQYLAFEALVSLILEQNGISARQTEQEFGLPIRSHESLIPILTSTLITLSENDKLVPKLAGDQPFDDYLDALRSYNNIARAVDLYLGIENAYDFYHLSESPLLTESEKKTLMDRFTADLDILYTQGIKQTFSFADGMITAIADEIEAGNRPLKAYLALGYASLSVQPESQTKRDQLEEYISSAMSRASDPVQSQERHNYWMYQTGNGRSFWAEGPYYFDFVLKDAISFWHAVRGLESIGQPPDPFFSDWFLNPVHWLANISTPDGSVPPVDDGNKRSIQSAALLRWLPDYGDSQIGEHYASIYDKIHQYPSLENEEDQFFLVEAAIPRIQVSGSTINSLTDTSGQQLVIRHADIEGGEHYIFLNGEHGQAITAGEGHEQPDQLQLLYYRDQYSFLVDPGYDRGYTQTNSTWNGYLHTNTMQYNASETEYTLDFVTMQNEGGLHSPFVSETEIRKVSTHNPATLSYDHPAPGVDILSGVVQLDFELPETSVATYQRSTIVVKGENPYLIDINDVTAERGRKDFVMRYHGNGSESDLENGWFYWSNSITDPTQPEQRLFLYTFPLLGNYSEHETIIDIQEIENRNASGEKEPYPIVRKSLESTDDSGRFVTAGLLQIRKSAPEYEPQFIRESPQISYIWKQIDSETGDLIMFTTDTTENTRSINIGSGPAAGLSIALSPAQNIGFTRLRQVESEWVQDEDFTAYLTIFKSPEGPSAEETHFFDPFPNPLRKSATFQYLLKDDSEVTIEVFDLLGRKVQTILNTNKTAGLHEETWNPDGLSSGVYMIRFLSETETGSTYRRVRKISVIN